MFDVFAFLFEHLHDLDYVPSRHSILEKLNEAGFDDEEINSALFCFITLLETITHSNAAFSQPHSHSIRIFSVQEKSVLSIEVQGYLHFLCQQEALKSNELEILIHALISLRPEDITLSMVKLMTLIVAWICHSHMPVLVGEELLDVLDDREQVVH